MSKIESAILHVLKKCGPMPREKLECMLYFMDFNYFELFEKPLFSNVEWVKGKKHPKLRLKKGAKDGK